MDQNNIIESGGFYFIHNFDSGNLGHVERVPTELIAPSINTKTNASETPDYEFNLWTRPDCAGTEFENGNRTWFYFGVQASEAGILVRLNLINLNKQGKMYNQGMAPVTRTLPGKPQWERIRDRPVHSTDDDTFSLSFKYRTAENMKATTFFAFTYPFSFAELQISLNSIDLKMLPVPPARSPDDIYYCRECLIYSLEGRRVDLLTITSHHGITTEREERLKNLFPDHQDRPYKFQNKKVIFISARVHPGETPSSFVFNGFLNLLLTRNDPIAVHLRRLYVFKMIPFLNPDGVARGHYRTDTRGVNLNRVYLNPSLTYHPTVYASRALIRYYHFGCEKEDTFDDSKSFTSRSIQNISESAELIDTKKKKGTSSPSYKGDSYKREKSAKSLMSNKSSNTIKPHTEASKKESRGLSGEAANLAEQVYDMKLQEMPSQTSDISSKGSNSNPEECTSLLNDNLLRSCLGSNVHLSTSEELNFQGTNPLRPLRDTLKNSISLLMESSSSDARNRCVEDKSSLMRNMKMGWCRECRAAVAQLEDTMPGIAAMVPGYSATMSNEPDTSDKSTTDSIYFCTNCFKKYVLSEFNEEIKLCEPSSSASVSAGDGVAPSPPSPPAHAPPGPQAPLAPHAIFSTRQAGSTGDTLEQTQASKEDKAKPPVGKQSKKKTPPAPASTTAVNRPPPKESESGLYLYIDLHGHASKKGIFMYGNHFEDLENCVECMLLPRIMSLNNLHFHFSSCNFTERNMYLKDRRDGMSREGSGRVAVLKATGLVRSYTLECNYNTGRLVNVLPPPVRDGDRPATAPASPAPHSTVAPTAPPKYTPHIFEEVGRSLGASILDLTGQHPNSRVPASEHRTLPAVRDWLRAHTRTMRPQLTMSRLRPKTSSPTRAPLYARSKGKVIDERKENTYVGAKTDSERRRSPPVLAPRSGHDIINMTMKFAKKNEPAKTASRTRYLSENEPKPKTLSTKRRNILAIRKPNSSKTQVGGVGKPKGSRRSVDDSENPRGAIVAGKPSKRSFARSLRGDSRRRPVASSSSSDAAGWEEAAGGPASPADSLALAGKRRSFVAPSPSHLKKIRLKTGL